MDSFLVIGMGRFGSSVACELAALGHDVLAVDKSEELIADVADCVTHAVAGDARDESVLRSLGAASFDAAVVAIAESVEDSVLITITLKELGVPRIIAKAQNSLHMKILQKIGADEVVFPERDIGKRVANQLSSKNIIDYIELSDDYSIVETQAPASWEGKTLDELKIRTAYGLNVIALRDKEGRVLNISPTAECVVNTGDILVVVGENDDIGKLRGEK